ncbi:signal peptidase I [Sandarakinorhabdus sp.]|uniref:signal peptidase I n=1 Tax=Sandarakinorhabdus sp. TaxID=1916663 RepID=UPI00333F13E8
MSEAVAKKKTNWAEEAWQLFLLGLAVLGVHTAVAKPFYIPSGSMLPTLMVGDRLIVSKYPYGYSYLSPSLNVLPPMKGRLFGSLPERGDIVVVKSPIAQDDWIKRVIGLPGDTVQMRDGQLWLNGQAVPKVAVAVTVSAVSPNTECASYVDAPYRVVTPDGIAECHLPTFRETLPNGRTYLVHDLAALPVDNTEAVIVPEGHVFLMGDNRDNSQDSRFAAEIGGLGLLPVENIVGRAEFTTFSLDGSTSFNPVTWVTALRDRWFLSLRS